MNEHETMTVEGKCPRCGEQAARDEVDVGVGVMTGPWGCSCGWSESETYDLRYGGGLQDDGSYLDPRGGRWPSGNPVVRMMRAAERPPLPDHDKNARQHVEGKTDENV